METSTALILIFFASVGAIDELFYHNLKANLLDQPSARRECVFHNLRQYVYAVLFVIVGQFYFTGNYIAIPLTVLALDFFVSVLDLVEEPRSRKPIGGLPNGEYWLHMFLAMFLGMFYFSYMSTLFGAYSSPPSFGFHSNENYFLQTVITSFGVISLFLGLFDTYRILKRNKLKAA